MDQIISKILTSSLILVSTSHLFACGETSDDTSPGYTCPTESEDSCMTEALYEECLEVVENCENGSISILESCPYAGFSCEG